MIKGEKRMSLSMLDRLYFSKQRPRTAKIKINKAVSRHRLGGKTNQKNEKRSL